MNEFLYTNIHTETPIGAGYYALRHTTSAGGTPYTKLVRADRSPYPRGGFPKGFHTPLTGKRNRIKHRARTCAAVNRGV